MIQEINSAFIPWQANILTTPCVPVEIYEDEHRQLVADLIDTASAHFGCIGLAANQIWKDTSRPAPSIAIVPGKGGWAPIINPTIDRIWKKEVMAIEGCMSLPKIQVKKERVRHIEVSYYGEDMQRQKGVHLFDLPARIFQHEYDHLQGKLIDE